MAAAFDKATNADVLTYRQVRNLRPNGSNATDDLVPWHKRIAGHAPVILHKMQIGVTDATEIDVDQDISRAGLAPVDCVGDKRCPDGERGIAFGGN
jgi:hypothetical protein